MNPPADNEQLRRMAAFCASQATVAMERRLGRKFSEREASEIATTVAGSFTAAWQAALEWQAAGGSRDCFDFTTIWHAPGQLSFSA